MSGYTKLFGRILDSTVWREDDRSRLLWITMLALADQHGVVECTIPGLADRARIPLEDCERALVRFQEPDKYSWSQEQEGRRIRVVDGGWQLINHGKYRMLRSKEERKAYQREWISSKRQVDKKSTPVDSRQKLTVSTKAEAEAEADSRSNKSKAETPPGLHPLNYATKILEEIAFPQTPENLKVVSAAIEAEIKAGKSPPSAYEFVLAGTLDAKEQGFQVNRFFFSDAKYRTENRGVNRDSHKTTAQLRSERSAAAIDRVFGGEEGADSEGGVGTIRKRTQR